MKAKYATFEQHENMAQRMDEASKLIQGVLEEGQVNTEAGFYLLRALHSIHTARTHLESRLYEQQIDYCVMNTMQGRESLYHVEESYKAEVRAQYNQATYCEPTPWAQHERIAKALRCARAALGEAANIGMGITPKACYLPLWRASDNVYLAADRQRYELACAYELEDNWREIEDVYLHQCPDETCTKRGTFC